MVAIATWLARMSACQAMGPSPTSASSALMSPDWSANSLEKMRPTATGATTKGSSTPIRQNVLARRLALSRAARPRPMMT